MENIPSRTATLQRCNNLKKNQKKVGDLFENRNESFLPLHCPFRGREDADGECENFCRPTKIFSLACQQKERSQSNCLLQRGGKGTIRNLFNKPKMAGS